jgi:hypothetical protein
VCLPSPKVGDPCFDGGECGAFACDFTTGKCVAGLAKGSPCAFKDPALPVQGTEVEPCASGLSCDVPTLTCVDPNCVGHCASDTDCDPSLKCVAGICSAPPDVTNAPEGAPCDDSGAMSCASNLYCDWSADASIPGVCRSKIGRGGLCTSSAQCWSSCLVVYGTLRCDGTPPGTQACSGR